MPIRKLLPIGALALAFGFAPAGTAGSALAAGPLPAVATSQDDSGVIKVHRRGFRRGVGIGIGVGVLGAIIASEAYRPRAGYYYDDYEYEGPYYAPSSYRGDPRVLCAENFRSFEWNTGLYTTYGGEKRLCPYLR